MGEATGRKAARIMRKRFSHITVEVVKAQGARLNRENLRFNAVKLLQGHFELLTAPTRASSRLVKG